MASGLRRAVLIRALMECCAALSLRGEGIGHFWAHAEDSNMP